MPLSSSPPVGEEAPPVRVVLLDDEPAIRSVFVPLAHAHGIEATAVATVDALRTELSGARPDLVILDFNLAEEQTSTELVKELLVLGFLVVIWTGDADHAREAIGTMTSVIPKSGSGAELFREVSRLVHARALAIALAVESGDLECP